MCSIIREVTISVFNKTYGKCSMFQYDLNVQYFNHISMFNKV